MTLRFGKVCKSNDPFEAKNFYVNLPYIDIKKSIIEEKRIQNELFTYLNNILQFICFSEGKIMNIFGDIEDDGKEIDIDDDIIDNAKLTDFSSRPPYYFPRMWAQYSKNQEGVCFIFKKTQIIEQIKKQVENEYHIKHKKIVYKDLMKEDLLLHQAVTQSYSYYDIKFEPKDFIQKYLNCDYKINYFYKDVNWRDEKEYRFLIWNKIENDNYENKIINIDNISLIGIVFGLNNKDKELKNFAHAKKIKNIFQLMFDGALFYVYKI
ncbi:MAG: DUF2971 domain-containing protein [Treponema sp.]|jgi:hypothetical protein|nr:DUF2971 domain-containing protein [Treponema sp.]